MRLGHVQMRGDTTPGVEVEVLADGVRISLLHQDELIGDWEIGDIGIQSLHDEFAIRAEGEEFVLKTDDDIGLAREIGIVAASPRMARSAAADNDHLLAFGFIVGGVVVGMAVIAAGSFGEPD